ncbi:uncharacterized protein VTP21DRAFT_2265 [Calcarisporiella thermophila]
MKSRNAWDSNHMVTVHGWIYDLPTGLIKDLVIAVSSKDNIDPIFRLESK